MGAAGAPAARRRTLARLAVATAVGGVGLGAGMGGAFVGARLGGGDLAAGVPVGVVVVGSAMSSWVIASATARVGRLPSLALGYLIGSVGAAAVVVAAAMANYGVLLAGSVLLGAGNAAIFLGRYAAASLATARRRGRALGVVFLATAVGAVASSMLLGPSARASSALGLPGESGLHLVAIGSFAVAAALLVAATRYERGTQDLAVVLRPTRTADVGREELRNGLTTRPARAAILLLATSNFAIVAVMSIVPVHLQHHGQTLSFVGMVVALHVAGMFGLAPCSGWLGDRAGPVVVAASGLGLLVADGAGAALVVPADSAAATTAVLAVLGVAWNLGVVGGSMLLHAAVPERLQPHVEAIGEASMGGAAAVAGPVSGVVAAWHGTDGLWLLGAAIAIVSSIAASRLSWAALQRAGRQASRDGPLMKNGPSREPDFASPRLRM